ncbi:MAG: hypothetical protein VCA37_09155 [Roseibacillus sp.]
MRYWFFAIFLTWIPLINLVAVPLLALFGKDQSKKNYYRALILWIVFIVALNVLLILVVGGPEIIRALSEFLESGLEGGIENPDETGPDQEGAGSQP